MGAEKTDPFEGRVINGRFTIIDLIARGGMGRVYRARQEPLGRMVALKVLDPRHDDDEDTEFQARFFLEASTAAKLSHPNTVTVFDYGKTDDDIYFIAMELVEGKTLSNLVKQNGPLEPLRAIHIAMQIARSLREAHGLGVIHRDLKPANVLIAVHADEESFVKVLDFGLVKDTRDDQELTQQGLFMGSPKYMSPEQIQGGDVDHRADIYSLGVILYWMLCGKAPFEKSTQVQTLMAHIKDEVPPFERADGVLVPAAIQEVTQIALSKEPEFRYQSMNQIISALRKAAGNMGAPISSSSSVSVSGEFDALAAIAMASQSPSIPPSQPPDAFTAAAPSQAPEPQPAIPFAKIGLALGMVAVLGGAAYAFLDSEPEPVEIAQTTTAPTGSTEAESNDGIAPARCTVRLESEPSGAEVFVGEQSYGVTPSSVEWVGDNAAHGREVTFRFARRGYRDLSVTRTILGPTLAVTANLRRTVRRNMNMGMRNTMMTGTAMDGTGVQSGMDYRDNPY